jgi:RND family efflux transporter MFP subunit
MVMPGDKIGVVVDSRNMKLKSSVAENEVALVRTGQSVELVADALPGEKFTGKVYSVAQRATSEHTYPIEILVANDKNESLKSGMFARAGIQVETAGNAIVVPSSAVLAEANRSFVFMESNGVARRIEVKLGMQGGDQTQIVEGLKSGDRLIVFGQQRLSDGARVAVQE